VYIAGCVFDCFRGGNYSDDWYNFIGPLRMYLGVEVFTGVVIVADCWFANPQWIRTLGGDVDAPYDDMLPSGTEGSRIVMSRVAPLFSDRSRIIFKGLWTIGSRKIGPAI
jgi:hypothetical protein